MQLCERVAALGADLQQLIGMRTGLERRATELDRDLIEQTHWAAAAEVSAGAATQERKRSEERHRMEQRDLRLRRRQRVAFSGADHKALSRWRQAHFGAAIRQELLTLRPRQ